MKNIPVLACALALLLAIPVRRALASAAAGPSAVPETSPSGKSSALSEIRVGLLLHDGALLFPRRESGHDFNFEILFRSPSWNLFRAVWSPRPHVGASISGNGDTSQLYGGFTWEWQPFGNAFIDGSLGLSAHDGALTVTRPSREGLGLRVLFRESFELGYRFHGRYGLSFIVDHISNAGLAKENDGITNVGLRCGYRF